MENPYYEIVSLMREQGRQAGGGLFSATVDVDALGAVTVLIDDEPVDEPFWLSASLVLTEEDAGTTVLCMPFDRGFLILDKLTPA